MLGIKGLFSLSMVGATTQHGNVTALCNQKIVGPKVTCVEHGRSQIRGCRLLQREKRSYHAAIILEDCRV